MNRPSLHVVRADPVLRMARAEDAQRLDDLRHELIARHEVRQQLKWIAVFALVIGVAFFFVRWVALAEVAHG